MRGPLHVIVALHRFHQLRLLFSFQGIINRLSAGGVTNSESRGWTEWIGAAVFPGLKRILYSQVAIVVVWLGDELAVSFLISGSSVVPNSLLSFS